MRVTAERFVLEKRHALTISRGTMTGSENVWVRVAHSGIEGWGEVAPNPITGDTTESSLAELERLGQVCSDLEPWDLQEIDERLASGRAGSVGPGARAGLDQACHDWIGKRAALPLWRLLGLDLARIAPTSLTIGINPPEVVAEVTTDVLARTNAKILKVKLGSAEGIDADKAIFASAQAAAQRAGHRDLLWRVDANGGWSPSDAPAMIAWLAVHGVEYVEQPLAEGSETEMAALKPRSVLPLYVDESIRVAADVPRVAACAHGVNLKLMKCGGLREALRIVHAARAHRLMVMIGCMGESSLSISAGAQLSPLVDCVDLDSHLNLRADPFVGATYDSGRVVPTDAPGLGARRA